MQEVSVVTLRDGFPASSKVRHGTVTGYNLHQHMGQEVCDLCANAKHAADVRWRGIPINTAKNRANAKAQQRALQDLRRRYPDEYKVLYAKHKEETWEELGL